MQTLQYQFSYHECYFMLLVKLRSSRHEKSINLNLKLLSHLCSTVDGHSEGLMLSELSNGMQARLEF